MLDWRKNTYKMMRWYKSELPVYGLDCTYCMRCFNYCPTLAVRYMNSRNRRVSLTPPFQGPVPEFHPKLIARQR